ncbi:MAG TPA: prepilin-type N-terminal cleavage/methylation domain-containing protein [Candidatus Acidoferrum sp.]|jgi:general secretion pathway protein G|nr:prepilin-type N-terminal cleavage/methylation domain-containing protein [Candidatus Acidoferrum sp.]
MVRGISKSGRINSQLVRAAEIRRRLGAIGNQRALQGARGFTLLELMIVISIIMILMAVAVPVYNQSIIQARESVLRSNLSTLRNVISQYTLDKQKAPQSLDDLVQGGYLRQVPVDPMTRLPNWEVVQEDVLLAVDQQDPGITDVHSASSGTASDGTAYSTW